MHSSPTPPVRRPPTSPPFPREVVDLWRDVQTALYALPAYFASPLLLQGISATDLFTFASSLGATIEQQVVDNLNRLRSTTWDQSGRFAHYAFERQPQRFPDVVLRSDGPGAPYGLIVMGIELKGWYALAKEGVPTFRYTATPAASSEVDLLVVFPWALSSVVAGSPFLLPPFVESARYAAEHRNYWWQHLRSSTGNKSIRIAGATSHYPVKSDLIGDFAVEDSGRNFGRIARTGLMDDFTAEIGDRLLLGIPIQAWRRFFQVFTENPTAQAIDRLVATLDRERRGGGAALLTSEDQVRQLRRLLEDMAELFKTQ